MSKTEIRRTRTDSPEIDAMFVFEQAMAPLDVNQRKRVLTWAEERWHGSVLDIRIARDKEAAETLQGANAIMSQFLEAISHLLHRMEEPRSPADLFRAIEFIFAQADELKTKRDEKAEAAEA